MSVQASNSGIVTDEAGDRHIPESVRADGSVRKAIKIRPGYKPAEDVQVYKNRTAETFRSRYKGGVVGAEAAAADDDNSGGKPSDANGSSNSSSAAANKNAKRREARKKAKAAGENVDKKGEGWEASASELATEPPGPAADADAELKKKARNLTKKLKQAKELKSKKDDGQSLLPEQFAKVIKINELVRELAGLGFDSEGEPVKEGGEGKAETVIEEDRAPA